MTPNTSDDIPGSAALDPGSAALDAATTVSRVGLEDSPLAARTVIGERYEVREELRRDGLSRSYLAFDQEMEQPVLLRRLAADLVAPGKAMRAVLERLRPKLGLGGRYLSGPIDADIEDDRLYVVEPLPRGVPLSSVMRRRASDERSFGAKEVLPVVAQIAAALAAIPPPHAHLEVTPQQIWVDPEGLMLTGSFLLGCLDAAAIARVVARDPGLALTAAPELRDGGGGDAADNFAVGRLAQALLLPGGEEPSALTLGPVAEAIAGLTRAKRSERHASLEPLIEGLARLGGLPAPELDAGAYRRPRARRRPSTRAPEREEEVSAIDEHLVRAAKAADAARDIDPRLLRAARPGGQGTQEITLDQIVDEVPARDDLDGLDPRLVRAALDMALDEELETELDEELETELDEELETELDEELETELDEELETELDEELSGLLLERQDASATAAAKAGSPVARVIPGAAREGTQEITLDQIVDEVANREDLDSIDPALLEAAMAPAPAPRPSGPPAREAPDTMELTLEDLKSEERKVTVPAGVKPVPRPRRPSAPGLVLATPVLYDDSRSLPTLDATTLPPVDARVRRARAPVPSNGRRTVVASLLMLSVLIVLASLGYAAYRHQRTNQLRQQRLEERYRQLQQESQTGGSQGQSSH